MNFFEKCFESFGDRYGKLISHLRKLQEIVANFHSYVRSRYPLFLSSLSGPSAPNPASHVTLLSLVIPPKSEPRPDGPRFPGPPIELSVSGIRPAPGRLPPSRSALVKLARARPPN